MGEDLKFPLIYAAVLTVVVFFIATVTGMFDSIGPRLIYSVLTGALGAGVFWLLTRFRKR